MPVDTRSTTAKGDSLAASTSKKPNMDDRIRSLEEANHRQASQLDNMSKTQKSDIEGMAKQMKEMSESLHRRFDSQQPSTQTTTPPISHLTPLTIPSQNSPVSINHPPQPHNPSSPFLAGLSYTQPPPYSPSPQPSPHNQPLPSFTSYPYIPTYSFFPTQPTHLYSNPTTPLHTAQLPQFGSYLNQNTSRLPRLEVPQFSGEGVIGWLFQIERYFALHATPPEQKLVLATFHMTGAALDWYFWMYATNQITNWGILQGTSGIILDHQSFGTQRWP